MKKTVYHNKFCVYKLIQNLQKDWKSVSESTKSGSTYIMDFVGSFYRHRFAEEHFQCIKTSWYQHVLTFL